MARKASVRYWPTRGTWTDEQGQTRHGAYCCTYKAKQYVLAAGPDDHPQGPTYLAAMMAFRDMIALDIAGSAKDLNTCRVIIEYYLRHLAQTGAPSSLRIRQKCLKAFCQTEMAEWPVNKLTPFAVNAWLDRMREDRAVTCKRKDGTKYTRRYRWGDGQIEFAVASLHAAFNHAAKQRMISVNPIRGLQGPGARSRSRDCVLSPEEHQLILSRTRGQFREEIICLENTGCRPGELLMATAKDWNDDLGALVYHAKCRRREGEGTHKTSRKGKERRIFFTGEALQIMRARVRQNPRGPLWPSQTNPEKAMTAGSLTQSFYSLAERVGLQDLTAYSYRHTYATRWLEAGRSIDDLAALMGNTPETIRRHYAHLCDNLDRMRQLAEGFNAERTETPPRVLPFGEAAG